jgi:hypothetical protein
LRAFEPAVEILSEAKELCAEELFPTTPPARAIVTRHQQTDVLTEHSAGEQAETEH